MAGSERETGAAAGARWAMLAAGAALLAAAALATGLATGAGAQESAPAVPGADAPALTAPAPDAGAPPPVAAPADLSTPAAPEGGTLAAPSATEGAAPAAPGPGTEAAPRTAQVPGDPVPAAPAGDAGTAAESAPGAPGSTPAIAADPAPEAAGAAEEMQLPRDLSPWGMYLQADIVVKAVMIGLAFASIVTWTVLVAKGIEFLLATLRLRRGYEVVSAAPDLATASRVLAGRRGPTAAMVRAAAGEARASAESLPNGGAAGLLQRVASHLGRIEHQAGRRLNAGTGVLATIGATAPFVGLFGTVWGIMNSFIGISESQTTNLAVVAPGIAEALLATAIGLVAAIPAVVVYNVFARWSGAYRARLADAAAAVERLVSRDLDHDRLGQAAFARAAE